MSFCTNCGHPVDEETGFCSYCGAEHSADGEVALPGRPLGAGEEAATVPVSPEPERTVPMPPQPDHTQRRSPAHAGTTATHAGSVSGSAGGSGRSSKGRWILLAVIVAIVAACAAVVAIVVLGDGGSSDVTFSPSPTPTLRAVVKIMSPTDGNKVIGGQAMRVAVTATGVGDLQNMQLAVNGVPTGPTKLGTGSGDSKTTSFPWRPPAKGGSVVLRAEAVLQDGTVVPSKAVRVVVRPAVVPTPTVTVTAQPEPSYGSSESSGGGSTDFWAAMMCSKTDPADAEDWAARARAAGFDNVHILHSSDYRSLRPGFWCAYLGPYASRSSASVAVSDLRDRGLGGDDPYPSHVYN